MERSYVMVKPDGVQRRLVGKIVTRFEEKGLRVVALRLFRMEQERAEKLYEGHKGKGFYPGLVKFVTSSPVVGMVIQGPGAIGMIRKMMGATFGPNAEPGTIRGDYGASRSFNLIHGSDSPESAAREIPIFFSDKEIAAWEPIDEKWTYDVEDLK